MGKVRRDFTREFKIEAVRLSHQTDKTLDEFADDMGISRSSLSRWRSEFREDPQQAFPGKGQPKERDVEIARLKKQLRQAEMERDILKNAGHLLANPEMKFQFIHEHRLTWPISLMCRLLGVSRSGYYSWRR